MDSPSASPEEEDYGFINGEIHYFMPQFTETDLGFRECKVYKTTPINPAYTSKNTMTKCSSISGNHYQLPSRLFVRENSTDATVNYYSINTFKKWIECHSPDSHMHRGLCEVCEHRTTIFPRGYFFELDTFLSVCENTWRKFEEVKNNTKFPLQFLEQTAPLLNQALQRRRLIRASRVRYEQREPHVDDRYLTCLLKQNLQAWSAHRCGWLGITTEDQYTELDYTWNPYCIPPEEVCTNHKFLNNTIMVVFQEPIVRLWMLYAWEKDKLRSLSIEPEVVPTAPVLEFLL